MIELYSLHYKTLDRVELDVRDRVQQRGAALGREWRACRHLFRRHETRQGRATGQERRGLEARTGGDGLRVELGVQRARLQGLGHRVAEAQKVQGALSRVHP